MEFGPRHLGRRHLHLERLPEIDLTVPITAYEGPIQIIRIPVTGDYVLDIKTGKPLLYQDPNTARVTIGKRYAFVDVWPIARTGATVLASNTVPVDIATDGNDRLQYGSVTSDDPVQARAARQALMLGQPIDL